MRFKQVPAADLVREIRNSWGDNHGVEEVHHFLCEIATCLLHYPDVEVGHVEALRFTPWSLDPWEADHKIQSELELMERFLEDRNRYVFRRKHAAGAWEEPP
ncbi:MAG: hypothetical protein KDL87_16365 [Verrucomicrobiae bacterium]|nr:hypothetical protein [Verrucomicrobiae bacterium]